MDEAELRKKVRSMVVFVEGSKAGSGTISFMGTIILVESEFLCVVVDRAMARDGFQYRVTLPDGSEVVLPYSDFYTAANGNLAVFYVYYDGVHYNTEKINAVQFAEEGVSKFDVVRMADFDNHRNFFLPGGRVNSKEDHCFMFDCSNTGNIEERGAPVVNENGNLVGISYKSYLLPCYAYSLGAIETDLFKLSDQPMETIEDFLEWLKS